MLFEHVVAEHSYHEVDTVVSVDTYSVGKTMHPSLAAALLDC